MTGISTPQNRNLQQALLDLDRAGDFAAHVELSAMGLSVAVDGVGPCRLPLSPDAVEQLLDCARPSPFGYPELTLRDWVDEDGHPCVGTEEVVFDSSIVSTVSSMRRHPYEIAGTPWMGNEGGTAAQWYHQAAVVLVSRTSSLQEELSTPADAEPQQSQRRTVIRRRKRSK